MKTALVLILFAAMPVLTFAQGGDTMTNVLAGIPYQDTDRGMRQLINEPHFQLMQAALRPGQSVPQHNANSNVHILVVEGEVVVDLAGKEIPLKVGDLLPVAYRTSMHIDNNSNGNASFLIIKTPNPSEMK
jgi:quercetin dioxygenase-like cupin family protein